MLFRIAAWGVAVGDEQMNLVIIHAYVFGLLASMIYTCVWCLDSRGILHSSYSAVVML